MELHKPSCYDSFHCLASACPDTCCQQWDIQVDPETAAYYKTIPGTLGEKVRASLRMEDGETLIALQNGHCPMQQGDGLCTLQAQLGEKALCQVCREFPRLRHDYGSFLELGLEMSCPEAARILLTRTDFTMEITRIPGGSEPEYDQDAMEVLLASRKEALKILSESRPGGDLLALLFFYGCHAQQLLDGEECSEFDPEAALETAHVMKKAGDFSAVSGFFREMEELTEQWDSLLKLSIEPQLTSDAVSLARYFVERYWLQAVSDYDLYCRVKFMLISCLLVSSLPGDFILNAHLYSKEIENDIDNVDAILDAAYDSPIFTDDKLLGFLLRTP